MQHVRANLAPPLRTFEFAAQLLPFLFFLFFFQLQQLGLENFHGRLLVLKLGTLILALYSDAGREVYYAHRRVSGIHALAAFAAGHKGIDAQIFGVNFYAFGSL